MLEADDRVIRVADRDRIPPGMAVSPLFDPKVIDVVQVDICQQRRDDRPLWRADRAFRPCIVFQYTRFQPLAYETQDALVANPMFKETYQPDMADRIEERPD